ncbi:MAG: hypothetical protein Q4A11_06235 [Brachymonas sp.]|nr:hypothetical protein [Brachymonas sp.]
MSTDIYRRLLNLLPAQPLLVGEIAGIYPDGAAQVTLLDGAAQVTLLGGAGEVRALNPAKLAKGTRCFVRGDAIIGSAPALPYEEGEI